MMIIPEMIGLSFDLPFICVIKISKNGENIIFGKGKKDGIL